MIRHKSRMATLTPLTLRPRFYCGHPCRLLFLPKASLNSHAPFSAAIQSIDVRCYFSFQISNGPVTTHITPLSNHVPHNHLPQPRPATAKTQNTPPVTKISPLQSSKPIISSNNVSNSNAGSPVEASPAAGHPALGGYHPGLAAGYPHHLPPPHDYRHPSHQTHPGLHKQPVHPSHHSHHHPLPHHLAPTSNHSQQNHNPHPLSSQNHNPHPPSIPNHNSLTNHTSHPQSLPPHSQHPSSMTSHPPHSTIPNHSQHSSVPNHGQHPSQHPSMPSHGQHGVPSHNQHPSSLSQHPANLTNHSAHPQSMAHQSSHGQHPGSSIPSHNQYSSHPPTSNQAQGVASLPAESGRVGSPAVGAAPPHAPPHAPAPPAAYPPGYPPLYAPYAPAMHHSPYVPAAASPSAASPRNTDTNVNILSLICDFFLLSAVINIFIVYLQQRSSLSSPLIAPKSVRAQTPGTGPPAPTASPRGHSPTRERDSYGYILHKLALIYLIF